MSPLSIPILYQDDHLVAATKPAGMPSHATPDPRRAHLVGTLQVQLERDAPLRLVHRLDALTSGVVLLATTADAATTLGDQFRERTVEKVYLAWVETHQDAPSTFTIDNHLSSPRRRDRGRVGSVRAGGDRAITAFEVVERRARHALILARPQTGRTHQIRVHLAERGLPIVGDPLYNPAFKKPAVKGNPSSTRLMLHAVSISFCHPSTGERQRCEAPISADFIDVARHLL